jgi:hypothetical protein
MATLTGNTIKDTYQSLLKVNDNGELAATLQEITDGVGNGSGVSLNTTGDLKAEGTIEFGSLKDTGEAITITKFVDEADGIANNDNDTSIPTSAAIIDYVAAKITEEDLDFAGDSGTGSVDLDSQAFTIGGTANQIETTATGQSLTIAFPSAGIVLPDGSTATTQATTDDSTKVATTAYVKSVLTQEDLDFQGDTGTGSVDLDSEVLDIAGGTGIDTVASGQTLTVNIDSTVATLTGTQTLTNKTINADNNSISNLEVDNLKAGVLDTDLTTVSASDNTLASAKAIKTYVDANITAQDLDITDGTTTSAVDLDSQTMTIQGTANEVEVSLTDQTFTVGLPDTINVNVSGNITGDITGNAGTATALETARDIALSGDVVGSASFDGTANITIAATIQADSVALGTDTTGDYVANLGTGTGVTIASNTGEGSQPTISVDYGSTANTAVEGDTEITINGTTNQIEITGTANQALGGAPSYTVGLPDDVTIAGSLIVSNDLTVNGTTTTVNTQTLSVEDPLIALAIANDANSVDTGFYAKYSLDSGVTTKFAGLFKDASDTDTFKLFKGLEVEPTTTVDTSGTGYALADIQVAGLEATTIVKTGGSSTEFLKADGSIDSNTYLTAESDTLDAVTTRGNTTSNSIQVGAATITGDLTVDTNTLYVDSTDNRVGIGTLNPVSKLTLEGARNTNTITLRTTDNDSGWTVGDEFGAIEFYSNDTSGGSAGVMSAISCFTGTTSGSTSELSFSTSEFGSRNVERMRINSGGDVSFRDTSDNEAFYWDASEARLGIGVGSSPSATLDVSGTTKSLKFLADDGTGQSGFNANSLIQISRGSASSFLQFISPNNQEQGILFGDPDDTVSASIRYDHADDYMYFETNNVERVRIDSIGRVGIGSDTPQTGLNLEHNNDGAVGGTIRIKDRDTQQAANQLTGAIEFESEDATVPTSGVSTAIKAYVASSEGGSYLTISTTDIGTSTLDERLRIDSNGRVGINDTEPSFPLTIYGGSGAASYDIFRAYAWNGTSNKRVEIKVDNTESDPIAIWNTSKSGGASVEHSFQIDGSEKMRIDSGGRVGINKNNPAVDLDIANSSSSAIIRLVDTNSTDVRLSSSGSSSSVGTNSNHNFLIKTNNTERVRIDSSGVVGIGVTGTTSFDGIPSLIVGNSSLADSGIAIFTGSTNAGYLQFADGTSGAEEYRGFIKYDHSTNSMSFSTNSTARTQSEMTIDSSGNVGIGVDPSVELHLKKDSNVRLRLETNNTGTSTLQFADPDDTNVGIIQYDHNDDAMIFDVNASERMRITSEGVVRVGAVSAQSNATFSARRNGANIEFGHANNTSGYYGTLGAWGNNGQSYIGFSCDNDDTSNTFTTRGFKGNIITGNTSGDLLFSQVTNANASGQTPTERMRITSGGDVEIPDGNITLNDTGNLNGSRFFGGDANGGIIYLYRASGSGTSVMRFYVGNSQVGSISTATGTSTSFNTTSDYRLKENVVPMEGALDRVDALKPSRFNFIADADKTVDGFLAHEVAEVVPEAISGEKDTMETQEYEVSPAVYEDVVHPAVEEVLDDDGNVVTPAQEEYTERVLVSEAVMGTREVPVYQGIDQSKLVPLLTAALQEAHTLIKELTARVEALESN